MALLTVEKRKAYFEKLGLGDYNEANIRAFQKKYLRKKDVDGIYGTDTDNLLRHVYNVKTYTNNFEPEEFKCECGGRYCTGYPTYMKKVELQNLQAIRDHWKKPMQVTCGMRCRPYNNSLVGSIPNSLHLTGYACDFNMDGVTESTAQRKAAIKWIKKLPNHHYTYGHGYNSYGASISATYMGTGNGAALHTDTSKPVTKKANATKKLTNGQKLAAKAWEFAYHSNTSKAKYPSGKAKPAYTAALNKYFGKKRPWSIPAKKGASCDVYQATNIRAAGLGNPPRGMGRSWLDNSENFKRVNVGYKTIKDGDIISIIWSNGKPHWCMAYKGKVLEASYNGFYPKTTNTLRSRLSKKGKQSVVVYRAKGNALHTDTNAPKKDPTLAEKLIAACKTQAEYMKNYKYGWESNPTVTKSKKKGTCVTYVACVLQRLGYLKSGQYIWHDGKGKVTHANSKMTVTYPSGTLKSLKGKLKAGDVVIAGDKKNTEAGSHIFIVTGKWTSKDNPYIWDNHSAERVKEGKSGSHTYSGSKKVIAVIRLK